MQIIGHRGAKGIAPENTLTSIERALILGVDWIEFDIRRTKDGHLVLSHDRHTGRIAEDRLHIKRSELEQLKELPTHSGEHIPTLLQVMRLVNKRANINIEIKSLGCEEQVARDIELMCEAGYTYDNFMVSSFNPLILHNTHKMNRHIPLGLLHNHWPLSFMSVINLRLSAVGFFHPTVSSNLIRLAKQRGLYTYAYTVNDLNAAKRLQKMGLDGVVTDYPDHFLALKHKHAVHATSLGPSFDTL